MEQISGVVKSIRYANEKTGYTVCDIRADKSVVALVGILPLLAVGENIVASGAYVNHTDFGRQFKADSCERKTPTREDEIKDYLSSGFIKGLGPATANRIVELFKDKTFLIFQFEPYRLSEVKGITPEKALFFGQAFLEHENTRSTMMLMQKFGIPSVTAVRICKKFGNSAESEVRRNPYRLAENDIGLSFKICDWIALSTGTQPYSKERLKAAILYILGNWVSGGNTYTPKDELINASVKLTGIDRDFILDSFDSLLLDRSISVENSFPDRVYTEALIEAERYCAKKLLALDTDIYNSIEEGDRLIERYETEQSVCLDDIQRKAVKAALSNGICIITGGPGTGKTTIIKSLIYILKEKGLSFILAAPTGRAAKRISETSGYEAKTIHRLLEVSFSIEEDDKPYFMRNEDNPLTADVVIVDEASMIDIVMMSALLKAFPPGSRLVLVGDADQLPSVGPGKVLSDIISSGRFTVVKLETIFRQSEESLIITNAHLINQGLVPAVNLNESDFYFIQKLKAQDVKNSVVNLCTQKIPEHFGFDPFKDIQVLSPMRKGETGIYKLNEILQSTLNPEDEKKPQTLCGNTAFRLGDRVMQIRNDYTMRWAITDESGKWSEGEGVYNGDLGIVLDIDTKAEILTVRFDDNRTCEYRFDKLENLEHAYAITVHKSQGTEFPAVIIPLFGVPRALVCRNLLYTAVTRARQLVVLVGSPSIMEDMIRNLNEKDRFTGLKERLSEKRRIF